jgi:poly(hydroxyalkanoate) depolymerase family esterase
LKQPPQDASEEKRRSRADRFAQITALLAQVLPNTEMLTRLSSRLGGKDGASAAPSGLLGRWAPSNSRGRSAPSTSRGRSAQSTSSQQAPAPMPSSVVFPLGDTFAKVAYVDDTGRRDYKLFIPAGYHGQPVPLIVMLHGCTQSADDFAAGTRMNVVAQQEMCFVAYPEQSAAANASKCWNWFSARHQQRSAGEPALIAGITRAIMRDYNVDARRVYVAGLSAGAAQAAIMGATYPDLYAAVGLHSGLAYGSAANLPSAFAAMRHGASGSTMRCSSTTSENRERTVPAIVFHGDEDTTVHPSNSEHIIAQSRDATLRTTIEQGRVPGGHAFSCTRYIDASGAAPFEHWVVHGAGHAWSGGSSAGSYTDPLGPDAAREMMRFFLEHTHSEHAQDRGRQTSLNLQPGSMLPG